MYEDALLANPLSYRRIWAVAILRPGNGEIHAKGSEKARPLQGRAAVAGAPRLIFGFWAPSNWLAVSCRAQNSLRRGMIRGFPRPL